MRRSSIQLMAFLGLSLGTITGCSAPTAPTTPATSTTTDDDHDHDRDKMLIAHLGKYHACLTAHLSSKDGNELDVFVETIGQDPTPVALPLLKLVGKAKRADDTEQEVIFEPAPANERPKDEKAGACSHYVAKTPWMKGDDVFTLTIEAELEGRVRKATWKSFNPKKYAHHED